MRLVCLARPTRLVAGLCLWLGWNVGCPAEEVLVVEQDYRIVRQDKQGVEAKDIRQKMYLSDNWLRIDEYSGPSKQPTETYLIDLKKKLIVDLDNENLTKSVEPFDKRRERLEERKRKIRADLENLPEGRQKKKTEELYRAMLDDQRAFKLVQDKEAPKKTIADAACTELKIVAADDPDYAPFQAYLHPDIELPYDSAEVLYLLQIIGGRMKEFLNKNKRQLHRLPMEMTADLAAGGTLHLSVVSVEKVDRAKLERNLNAIPDGYKEKAVVGPPQPPKKAPPD